MPTDRHDVLIDEPIPGSTKRLQIEHATWCSTFRDIQPRIQSVVSEAIVEGTWKTHTVGIGPNHATRAGMSYIRLADSSPPRRTQRLVDAQHAATADMARGLAQGRLDLLRSRPDLFVAK